MWAIFPVCVIETRSFGWRAFPRRTGAVQMARRFPQPYGAAFRAQPRLKDCRGVRRAVHKGFPISTVRASMGGRDLLRESRGRPSPRRRPRTGLERSVGRLLLPAICKEPGWFFRVPFLFPVGRVRESASPRPGCGVGMVRDARARGGRRRARTGHGMRDARQRAGTGSMRGRRRRIRPQEKRGTQGARMRKGIRAPVLSGGGGACAPFPPGGRKASRGPVRSSRRQPYGTRRCCRRTHSCRARRIRRRCRGRR